MRDVILDKLHEIEQEEHVRILLAVESGSRAWGFASPDSDYDVRFIYVRPKNDYLRLEEVRDVIELPINEVLDINGWDLNKALRLLYKSNPTLFEWLSSPIVYLDNGFRDRLTPFLSRYFSCKHGLYHYIGTAKKNYHEFLQDNTVKAKKYFYVLRPVLACKWILERGTQPPMLFSQLAEAELDDALKPEVERLLDLKMNAPETKMIPRVDALNKYLEDSMESIERRIKTLPETRNEWQPLNELFLAELGETI